MQVDDKKFSMKTDGFLPRNKSIECYHRQGNKLFGIKFKISPIIFKTNGSIIVADPRIITTPRIFKSRIAAFTDAVVHAVRPSVLTLAHSNDLYPLLLQRLDTEQVAYQVMRFQSEPGVDLLVVTPLSRAISPFESHSLGASFGGC